MEKNVHFIEIWHIFGGVTVMQLSVQIVWWKYVIVFKKEKQKVVSIFKLFRYLIMNEGLSSYKKFSFFHNMFSVQ